MGSQPIRIQLGKILRENLVGKFLQEILAGKSCGKIFQKNLAGNSCGKFLWEILVGNSCEKIFARNAARNAVGNLVGNFAGNFAEKVLMVCKGSKNGKKTPTQTTFGTCWNVLSPLQPLKHYQTISIL